VNAKSQSLPALLQDASEHSARLDLQNLNDTAADTYQSAANWAEFVTQCFFLVNLDTIPLAPAKTMQFGRALWRIISTVHQADPRLGPVFLSKIDIADGLYRIWVNANDVPKLGVVVPTLPGQPKIIGFPLVLPMGWMQSPPLFTAATETVADLANHELQASAPAQPHRLDIVSESQGVVPEIAPAGRTVA
jgi:hypothetical protein